MWCVRAVLLLAACACAQLGEDDRRVVQLVHGPVLGHLDPTDNFYAFYNIPYATAPTGIHRFKAPLPPPVWIEPLDAVDRRIRCLQPIPFLDMREDCLVVNVFVPNTNDTNLPVVINIHGGAYQYGYGNSERLTSLVQTNQIIAVTFNYRLGVHGFLCLGTEDAPGNAGLKDQVALLRWVNKNIARFGGNPNDVTLHACSAGAGSIDVLTLSSITDGLYQRAILQSGVSLGAVGVQIDPIKNARTYARLLNFSNAGNASALEEFYKTASYQELLSRADAITNNENSAIMFGPCVERDIGQERVLDDAPVNIIKRGDYTKVPLMYGFANMEGLMRTWVFDDWRHRMNDNFADFLPAELGFESDEEREEIARTVKEFYFGEQDVNEQNILSYIDYFTDVLFGYPVLRALTLRVESLEDTIYLYEYSFVDENTPSIPHTDEYGANHCEQTIAVLDEDKTNITEEYSQMKAVMRELWGNFILTGSPVGPQSSLPSWPAAGADRSPHMSLGRAVELKGALLEDRAAFWDSIYERHYRTPIPPYVEDGPSTGAAGFISNQNFIHLMFFVAIMFL